MMKYIIIIIIIIIIKFLLNMHTNIKSIKS
jgi:hypothetical protein